MNLIAVFIGGGLGAVLRYLLSSLFAYLNINSAILPTFFVNIAGSFFLGVFSVYFLQKLNIPECYKLFLTVGFCGGLTTFSTFSYEIFNLLTTTQYIHVFLYIFISIFACVSATILGVYVARII